MPWKFTPTGDLELRIPRKVWQQMVLPQNLKYDAEKDEVVCTLASYEVFIKDLKLSDDIDPDAGECKTLQFTDS